MGLFVWRRKLVVIITRVGRGGGVSLKGEWAGYLTGESRRSRQVWCEGDLHTSKSGSVLYEDFDRNLPKKNCKIPHFLPILSNVAVCCCKLTQFTSIMSHAVLRESSKTERGARVLLHMWGRASQREEQYQIIQESLHSTKIAPRIFTTWTWSQSPPAPCWRESFKWTSWNESGLMFHASVCLGPVMGILISKVKNGWVTVVMGEELVSHF